MTEEDLELTPAENDKFWDWLNKREPMGYVQASPIDAINAMLAAEPEDDVKIGRNDPCPCGSGKKHKRCCG